MDLGLPSGAQPHKPSAFLPVGGGTPAPSVRPGGCDSVLLSLHSDYLKFLSFPQIYFMVSYLIIKAISTMTEKFHNQYRIPSARARWWDYGWNGAYFITICTKNQEHFLGQILDEQMHLSESGMIAENLWREIPNNASYVELGEFIVMPNHIHGILILDKPQDDRRDNVQTRLSASLPPTQTRSIRPSPQTRSIGPSPQTRSIEPSPQTRSIRPSPQTRSIASLQAVTDLKSGGITGRNNPMNHENISRIMRWYKGRCSFEIRKTNSDFSWLPRFHDHIIRDAAEYERIADYILNNPKNWGKGKLRIN
jgi:putative transposase